MRDSAVQTIKDAADSEAKLDSLHLHSLDMSSTILLHYLWKKDPNVLRLLRFDKEEFIKKVCAIDNDTYLEKYPPGVNSNEESNVDVP
uniref:Uncharacterized protein n=1 Tax=Cannabis sativa TaxID=3483 RepID=A0A803PKI2_CANSA